MSTPALRAASPSSPANPNRSWYQGSSPRVRVSLFLKKIIFVSHSKKKNELIRCEKKIFQIILILIQAFPPAQQSASIASWATRYFFSIKIKIEGNVVILNVLFFKKHYPALHRGPLGRKRHRQRPHRHVQARWEIFKHSLHGKTDWQKPPIFLVFVICLS